MADSNPYIKTTPTPRLVKGQWWLINEASKSRHVLQHMGVSKNSGTPKWMVYNGKPD